MSTVPSMRPDSPPTPSLERQELQADFRELDRMTTGLADYCATLLSTTKAAKHVGGLNKARLREVLIEQMRDETHDARQWILNRLEQVD